MAGRKPGRGTDPSGRSKRDGKHVRHYEYMLASAAYRALTCRARCLLTELKRLFNGENNGALYLSVRDAAELLRCDKDTATKTFRELEDHGFIAANQRGTFSLKVRHASTWILTEFDHAGETATKLFMKWKPVRLVGTDSPNGSDRVRMARTDKSPHGPTGSDRQGPIGPSHGPTGSDTYSLPGGTLKQAGRSGAEPSTRAATRSPAIGVVLSGGRKLA